jgi:hypothetical protein
MLGAEFPCSTPSWVQQLYSQQQSACLCESPELCERLGPAWQLLVVHVQGHMGTSTRLRGQGGVEALQEHQQAWFSFGTCMYM